MLKLCGVVLPTINLDDQPGLQTHEIHNVRSNWDLSAKAASLKLAHSQYGP